MAPISPPEPGLAADEMVRRAEAMRPMLRENQARCEAAGRLPEETHEAFVAAGFYRAVQPRMFGGYELDLPAFIKVMSAVARGCSDSAWVLALTSGHAAVMAAFPAEGQRDAFGAHGELRAPGVAMPGGRASPEGDGYRVQGAWDYASGCDIATHFLGGTIIQSAVQPAGGEPAYVWMLFDRDQCAIVDNWSVVGMQGTGSRRVVVNETFVPRRRVLPWSDAEGRPIHDQPGRGLHTNPLYHGRFTPLLISEVASVAVGAARGALDIYADIISSKQTSFPPFEPRYLTREFQHYYGIAQSLVDTAEAALLKMGADYMEFAQQGLEDGISFSDELEKRLLMIEQQTVRLSWEAVELLFRTAGTSAAGKLAPLGRYFRNIAVMRTHITLQLDHTAVNAGRLRFGLPALTRL